MRQIIFGRWGDEVTDRRTETEAVAEAVNGGLPQVEKFPESLEAVMCGKGLLVLGRDFDCAAMIREYVGRIQSEFCCGKCLTGLKGTKMLQVVLDKIAAGDGEEADLSLLERVANVVDESAKCSVCQSAGELLKDGLKHFRDHFIRAVESGIPEGPLRYVAKLSAPCMAACPCHINIPGYVEMLQEVRYADSLRIIRENMPIPGITGRVCPAPCETACTLAGRGGAPIPIRVLKRVAADYEMEHKLPHPLEPAECTGDPVAVIGAGPAGLAAAYYLNRLEYRVTIFEALPVRGGMVGVGIPPYRQPRDVLARDVDIILGLGVELEEGVRLGQDLSIEDLFARGFKAVLIAVGAHKSIPIGIKGEDDGYKGVFKGGIDFLRDINLGKDVRVGDKVIIVGGGNTAIDCARTCLRMGAAEVNIVYRRTEKEMPAEHHEVLDSMEEGIRFHFLTQPIEVIAHEGKMTALKCIRMELGEPDGSGRRRPVPVEGSDFEMEADTLIPAIGQKASLDFLSPEDGMEMTRRGAVKVDETTMMTSRPGVFAAGDAVTGPLTVVHGVAGGKRAAEGIHEYLTGSKTGADELNMEVILEEIERDRKIPVTPRPESRERSDIPQRKLDMRERTSTFEEVDAGFTQYASYVESSRCLRCCHVVMAALRD
jgi:formate dehydrogenase beta subunit